ncbi:MAG: transketolase C-terminal domain-containing protein [Anaerolineae bacterium]
METRLHDCPGRGLALLDGSRLIVESCARAGADTYIGYPITPASLIYSYASRRFPNVLPAPDEITALQWMAGLSASGKLPVTATSFPGLALMVESINMAYMMELPMLIVLVQRLGPSTGTATAGAQDDLRFVHGMLSGGYPVPTFCIADVDDCWILPPVALRTAVEVRTPVVLLTSKEMVMTERSFDLSTLGDVEPITRRLYVDDAPYQAYAADSHGVPSFLPIGDGRHQVRITASTHDQHGILRHSTPEALDNTRRLPAKVTVNTPVLYYLEEREGAETLIVTYGITAGAAREAVKALYARGEAVSLLVARTLVPIPRAYYEIIDHYPRVVFAEENLQGQFSSMLFGDRRPDKVRFVGDVGHMVRPEEIVREVCA